METNSLSSEGEDTPALRGSLGVVDMLRVMMDDDDCLVLMMAFCAALFEIRD